MVTDELGRSTITGYDTLGRVVQVNHNNGLADYYGYDELGHQTSHWNSLLGGETTGYDIMGRVTGRSAYGNVVTGQYTYWNDTLGSGLGATGGWVTVTTAANGLTAVESSDQFGHQLTKQDLGGHYWTMSYDLAGRMTGRAGQDSASYTWLNTGLVSIASGNGTYAEYGYDAAGARIAERLWRYGVAYESATATFDAMGRMTSWSDLGPSTGSGQAGASLLRRGRQHPPLLCFAASAICSGPPCSSRCWRERNQLVRRTAQDSRPPSVRGGLAATPPRRPPPRAPCGSLARLVRFVSRARLGGSPLKPLRNGQKVESTNFPHQNP